jgi:hypothetical protein
MTLGKRGQGVAVVFGMLMAGSALAQVNHNPTTEPRTGPNHLIVFTFDKPVTGGTATVAEGIATVGTPVFSGNEMQVPLTGVTDIQYVTLNVSAVVAADGGTGGTGSARVGFLFGDVNASRTVSPLDIRQIVLQSPTPQVTAANYLLDINVSGSISPLDIRGAVLGSPANRLPTP